MHFVCNCPTYEIHSACAQVSSASAKYLLARRPFIAAVAASAALVYNSPVSKQAKHYFIYTREFTYLLARCSLDPYLSNKFFATIDLFTEHRPNTNTNTCAPGQKIDVAKRANAGRNIWVYNTILHISIRIVSSWLSLCAGNADRAIEPL